MDLGSWACDERIQTPEISEPLALFVWLCTDSVNNEQPKQTAELIRRQQWGTAGSRSQEEMLCRMAKRQREDAFAPRGTNNLFVHSLIRRSCYHQHVWKSLLRLDYCCFAPPRCYRYQKAYTDACAVLGIKKSTPPKACDRGEQ